MNRIRASLSLLVFLVLTTMAQERIDVIHLKNGDVLRGVITENVPNSYVRIEIQGGSSITVKYSEVAKFTRELPSTERAEEPVVETTRTDTSEELGQLSRTEFELHMQNKDTISIIGGKATITYVGDPWGKSRLSFGRTSGVSKYPRGPFTEGSLPISRGDVFYFQISADLSYKVEVVQEMYNGVTLSFTKIPSDAP
jgi:hypothetical protein